MLALQIMYAHEALVQDIHGEEVSGQADWEVVQHYQNVADGSAGL